MKILIVEDDYVSSTLLKTILAAYGECDTTADGSTAIEMFRKALASDNPYHLICLDIMLPNHDGHHVLREVRRQEEMNDIKGLDGVKIIMMTALSDNRNIMNAFNSQCDSYIIKPIRKEKVIRQLADLGLIPPLVDIDRQPEAFN